MVARSSFGACRDDQTEPIPLDGGAATGVMVGLPQTRDPTVSTSKGAIAAEQTDLAFLQQRRPKRHIIAARVLDVREITDLLGARVFDWTPAAVGRGVIVAMTGREALERMFQAGLGCATAVSGGHIRHHQLDQLA